MSFVSEAIRSAPSTCGTVISIALMLICGFGMTRITKLLRLPTVTAYLITGILLGPYVLGWIPKEIVSGMDFLPDIALPFIAFSIGEFFSFDTLRKSGIKTVLIAAVSCLIAAAAVFAASYWILRLHIAFSLIFAALAAVQSPATTVLTVRQTGAKGDLVDTLLQMIAIDDIIGLLVYAIAVSAASPLLRGGTAEWITVLKPLLFNLASILIGAVFGIITKLLLPPRRTVDNRLIIAVALLLTLSGICSVMDVSPLLACMTMGTVYYNLTKDEKLFRQLAYFSPPILLLFFVRSGLNFDLSSMATSSAAMCAFPLIAVSLVYFAVRAVGQYGGTVLGSQIVKKPKSTKFCLGLALLPQASVAIGLASLASRELGGEAGTALETVIISASIINELIGPALTKLSLSLSGSYSTKLEDITAAPKASENGETLSDVELLIRRIRDIQKKLPDPTLPSPEEQAFNEASEEHYAAELAYRRRMRKR